MSERDVYVRLSVKDAAAAADALRAFGKEGERALERIETATGKPNRALTLLDRTAATTSLSLRGIGEASSFVGGPLDAMTGRLSSLAGVVGRTGLVFGGVGLAIAGTALALKEAGTAAAEAEREQFKIDAVLKATGFSAGLTAEQIDRYTLSLAKSTLATDSGAKAAATQLLTFKSVAGDTFARTLTLAQDLAATGFGSLESAAVMLGKALEDPARGLTALRRVGVSFTEAQEDVIQKLFETGQVAEAQGKILDVVARQVGGTGEAEGQSLTGSFHRAAESIGEFIESAGKASGLASYYTWLANSAAALADAGEAALNPTLADRILENANKRAAIEERVAAARAKGGVANPTGLAADLADLEREKIALDDELRAQQGDRRTAMAKSEAAAQARAAEAAAAKRKADDEKAEKERLKGREKALDDLRRLEDEAFKQQNKTNEAAVLERLRDRQLTEVDASRRLGELTEEEAQRNRLAVIEAYNPQIAEAYAKPIREQLEEVRKAADKEAAERLRAAEAGLRAEVEARKKAAAEVGVLEDEAFRAKNRDDPAAILRREAERDLAVQAERRQKGLLAEEDYQRARRAIEERYEAQRRDVAPTFGEEAAKEVEAYFETLGNAGRRAGDFITTTFDGVRNSLRDTFVSGEFSARKFIGALKNGLAGLAADDLVSGIGGLFGLGGGRGGGTVTGSFLSGLAGGAAGSAASSAGSWLSDIGSSIAGFFGFRDGGMPGKARPGLYRGKGTATSDSNLIYISDQEYIVNAAATRRHLPLLEAINGKGGAAYAANDNIRRFAWGGSTDDDWGSDYGDSDAFGSSYSGSGAGLTESQRTDRFGGGSDGAFANDDAARPGEVEGYGSYTYNSGLFGRSWSYDDPVTGNSGSVPFGGRAGAASETGLRSVFDRQGRVVDRFGGTFGERIGTFFGAGLDDGFLGSAAAGWAAALLSALVPGGMFVSGLANVGLNLGREALTGGRALNVGFGGHVADALYNDAFNPGGTRISDRIDRALGLDGSRGFGPRASSSLSGAFASDDRPERDGGSDPAGRNLLLLLRQLLGSGASALPGFAGGGRGMPGQSVWVGERGPEVLTFDRPGHVSPIGQLDDAGGPDMTDVIRASLATAAQVAALRKELRKDLRGVGTLAGFGASALRGRRTAA